MMQVPMTIEEEFFQMALDPEPDYRDTNLSSCWHVMSDRERDNVRTAINAIVELILEED